MMTDSGKSHRNDAVSWITPGTMALCALYAAMAGLFFLFDLSVPLGVAGGVPYIALVLAGLWFPRRSALLWLAAIGSVLTLLGYFMSLPAAPISIVLINRGLAMLAIWTTAVLAYQRRGVEAALEERVLERTHLLGESEARLHDAADAGSNWFWEMDADLRFTHLYGEALKRTGYDPRDFIGKTRAEVSDFRLEPEKWRHHLDDLEHHRPFLGFESKRTFPDGSAKWVKLSGNPIFDDDGEFKGYRGTGADITERVEAGLALRESETKFRNLIEGSVQGVMIHRDLKPLMVNDACARIYGYDSPREMLALDSSSVLLAPSERARLERYHQARMRGEGVPTEFQFQGLRKDGGVVWLQSTSRIVDWDGEPAVQVTVADISERVRAEEALRTSERNMRLITDAMPVLISYIDTDFRYKFANEQYREWYGVDPAVIIGKRVSEVIGEERSYVFKAQLERSFAGEASQITAVVAYPDGKTKSILSFAVPDIDDTGKVAGSFNLVQDITEHTQAKESLRESEERLRLALGAAKIGIWVRNLDDGTVYWDDQTYKTFGVPQGTELRNVEDVFSMVHPEDAALVKESARRLVEDGVPFFINFRIIWPDESIHHVASRAALVRDEQGNPLHVTGVSMDVTGQVRAEETLRESEERLSLALGAAKVGVWERNFDAGTVHWDDQAYRIFGVPLGTTIPDVDSVYALMHPEDVEFVRDSARRSIEDGVPYFIDYRVIWPDDSVHYITSRAAIILDDQGKPQRAIGVCMDVTERKQAETARIENDRRLGLAMAAGEIGVWERTLPDNQIIWDDRVCEIFGFDAGSPPRTHTDVQARIHPEDLPKVKSFIALRPDEGEQVSIDYRVVWLDGSVHDIAARAVLVSDDDGKPTRVVGVCTDVTAAKQTEGTLRQAKDEAELANRTKTEFLANISHELRTPLNAIIGFSETMMNGVFGPLGDDKYATYAADIHQSGETPRDLINDILDASHIEVGTLQVESEAVAVNAVIESSLRLVRQRADDHGVTVRTELMPESAVLTGDARRLKQVLLNLLSNAVKFTLVGGTVTLRSSLEKNHLVIAVHDTGIGMSADEILQAFAVFGQVDSRLERAFEGSGLGLPLAKKIVELHGGTLELESIPGVGTTATVRLPKVRLVA